MKEVRNGQALSSCENGRLQDSPVGLPVGYMRVSKTDGS
jgi:hypothetical protein